MFVNYCIRLSLTELCRLAAYGTQKAEEILLHGLMCGDFPLLCLASNLKLGLHNKPGCVQT